MQASAFVYGQDVLYAARGRACIPAGEGERAQGIARTRLASKSVTEVTHFGGASVCRKKPLNNQRFLSDLRCAAGNAD